MSETTTHSKRIITIPEQSLISCSNLTMLPTELAVSFMSDLEGGWKKKAAEKLWQIMRDGAAYEIVKSGINSVVDAINNIPAGSSEGVSEIYSPMGYDEIGVHRVYN